MTSLESLPYPDIRERAEAWARDVLTQYWPEAKVPVDPVQIARRMGVEVFSAELGNDVYGVIRGGRDSTQIYVDEDQPDVRWRFTVAHELGHYVQHIEWPTGEPSYVDRRSDRDVGRKDEVFANHFAGALLMPAAAVLAERATRQSPVSSATRFRVSPLAWKMRSTHVQS